eukprot:378967-Rhodomonas_salina.1
MQIVAPYRGDSDRGMPWPPASATVISATSSSHTPGPTPQAPHSFSPPLPAPPQPPEPARLQMTARHRQRATK